MQNLFRTPWEPRDRDQPRRAISVYSIPYPTAQCVRVCDTSNRQQLEYYWSMESSRRGDGLRIHEPRLDRFLSRVNSIPLVGTADGLGASKASSTTGITGGGRCRVGPDTSRGCVTAISIRTCAGDTASSWRQAIANTNCTASRREVFHERAARSLLRSF